MSPNLLTVMARGMIFGSVHLPVGPVAPDARLAAGGAVTTA
jgi:hypothetical protein